ncbi:MAG: hypothetical protein ACOCRO_07620, partial [Halanaerobiales bacterium]
NLSSLELDAANNMYILDKNSNKSKIHKLTKNSLDYDTSIYVNNNNLRHTKKFNINLQTGSIYIMNSLEDKFQSIDIDNIENFTENKDSFQDPFDYKELNPSDNRLETAEITEQSSNTPLMPSPYHIETENYLEPSQKLIILEDDIQENPYYNFVMITNQEHNLTGYVLDNYIEELEKEQENIPLRILNNNTPVYKYPTANEDDDESDFKLDSVDKETTYNAYQLPGIKDDSGFEFYEVQLEEDSEIKYGYINTLDAVNNDSNPIRPSLYTNAEIIINDDSEEIGVYTTTNLESEPQDYLDENKRIHIVEKEVEQGITKIEYLDENDEIKTGYVETMYIYEPDDYSNLLKTSILLIISAGPIFALFFFIKNRKPNDN